VQGEVDLLEIVETAKASGGLADLLDGGQEQANENGNDGYHHQQLDQRETCATKQTHANSRQEKGDP
jgi:hypothetical protein